jgi:hypothetical protein
MPSRQEWQTVIHTDVMQVSAEEAAGVQVNADLARTRFEK